jgi:hypothetical protein
MYVFAVAVVLSNLTPCLVSAEYSFVTDIWISVFEMFKHCGGYVISVLVVYTLPQAQGIV